MVVKKYQRLSFVYVVCSASLLAGDERDTKPIWRYEQGKLAIECRKIADPIHGKRHRFEIRFCRDDGHSSVLLVAPASSASGDGRFLDDYRPVYFNLTNERVDFVANWDGVRAFVFTRRDDQDAWTRAPAGPISEVPLWNGAAVWARIWSDKAGKIGLEIVNERQEYGLFYLNKDGWKPAKRD
jgi:hypothetical protein